MRVCFAGAYDPGYPRNRILRAGLARAGVSVVEARVRERRAWLRYPELGLALLRGAESWDVILIPEFRHKDVPLARLLRGPSRLVFDPLVSRWDTLVQDWGLHAAGSAQARWNRGIDRLAFRCADLVLCDTWAHGALFESLGAPRDRLRRVLVGAEDEFFELGSPPAEGPVRVLYLGGFLPLHGVTVIVDAIARLEGMSAPLPDWRVDMVGRGIDFDRVRAQAERAQLTRLELPGARPYAQAPAAFASAHIVLGAFGTTPKAGRVIPHKVYQGLAAGRAVVTGEGPGVREVFTPDEHLIAVPRGDAVALAEALARLIRDESLRQRVGAAGRARAREVATVDAVGSSLLGALETLPRRQ